MSGCWSGSAFKYRVFRTRNTHKKSGTPARHVNDTRGTVAGGEKDAPVAIGRPPRWGSSDPVFFFPSFVFSIFFFLSSCRATRREPKPVSAPERHDGCTPKSLNLLRSVSFANKIQSARRTFVARARPCKSNCDSDGFSEKEKSFDISNI